MVIDVSVEQRLSVEERATTVIRERRIEQGVVNDLSTVQGGSYHGCKVGFLVG